MYTLIPYKYVDASHYHESSVIVLDGTLTPEQVESIAGKLDEGENFIPADLNLGIEELQERLPSFPSDDDVVWHELHLHRMKVVNTVPEGTTTIDSKDFIAAFDLIKDSSAWDIVGATERLDLPM